MVKQFKLRDTQIGLQSYMEKGRGRGDQEGEEGESKGERAV